MNRTKLAMVIAMAGGFTTAVAFADQSRSYAPSAYEYGNYDYYNAAQQAAPATPTPAAPAAPTPAAPAAGSSDNSSSSSCSSAPSTDNSCSAAAAAPSCSSGTCNSCSNGCGCDTCTDCNGCCHEKLPHLLHCCCKLKPCFCWDDSCPLTCPDVTTYHLTDDCCCLKEKSATLTGWISGGIMGNNLSPGDHFNGPVTFADQDTGSLNQLYAVLQRTKADLSKNCGWWFGGDIDFMWGSDYIYTTSAGLDGSSEGNIPRWRTSSTSFDYGFAMPQLYAETDYDDLRIKWGHFYTIIGYEVVPDIGNFFYTHAYTMQYGEPFTHTGVLASRNINDNWAWNAGVVAGWNDFTLEEGAQFLGGITYTDKDYGSLAFSIITGNESEENVSGEGPDANRTMISTVWTRNLTSRLTYVFQNDDGWQSQAENFDADGGRTAEWYGINQYLFYKINCCWTFGWRFEWFKDKDGFVVAEPIRGLDVDTGSGTPVTTGGGFAGSFYETSIGLNYKPNGNFALRPELRYDWYTGAPGTGGLTQPYGDGNNRNQFLFGLDAIYQW